MISRRKRIAVLMAGVDREYQHALTNGMAEATRAAGVDLCIFNCQGQADGFARDDRSERAIFDLPDLGGFDGAVVLLATIPTKICRDQIRAMLDKQPEMPLVTIDVQYAQSVQVTFDDDVSMREIMEHLLDEHGARSFAVVTGPLESRVSRNRLETCRQVLAERGIDLPEENVFDGHWVRDGGRQAAEHFLKTLKPLPRAIICGNDDIAFGVIEVLRNARVRVPEDVLITGFDARQEAVGRGLTTIRRPVRKAGSLAIRTLLDWMENGRPEHDEVTLPTHVIYGDSCGCPPDVSKAYLCVQMLSDEQRLTEKCLRQTTDFVTGLARVSTLRGLADALDSFTQDWNPREMHVCVNPDFMHKEVSSFPAYYPEEMMLLSGWTCGGGSPMMRFPREQLLPRLASEREEPMAVVFSPLSYMGSNLGYMVYDVEHVVSVVLPSLLLLMASSLTSISLRWTVQSYASQMAHVSIHDALTGLYNRRGMHQLLPGMFKQAMAESRPFAMLVCDMDDQKSVNDRFGHLAGDQAICRLGRALRSLEDEGLTCIHISGDEFVAIGIPRAGVDAEELKAKLNAALQEINTGDPWLCDISISVGVHVAVPQEGDKSDTFMLLADNKMYAEKHLHHRRVGQRPIAGDYTD